MENKPICPLCQSKKTAMLNDRENNIQYGLVKIDRNYDKPIIDIDNVIAVDVYGCAKCGFIYLGNQDLIEQDHES